MEIKDLEVDHFEAHDVESDCIGDTIVMFTGAVIITVLFTIGILGAL